MIFYFLRHKGEFFTAILPTTPLLPFQSPYLVPVVHVSFTVEFVLNRKLKSLNKPKSCVFYYFPSSVNSKLFSVLSASLCAARFSS